jgi:hypothetical protein
VFKGMNSVQLTNIIVQEYNLQHPDAIVIEAPGGGDGVIDQLRHNHHLKVFEFWPGAPSAQPERFYRKRDELWHLGKDWLINGGCIDDDEEFFIQITGLQYGYDRFEQKLKMESKELYKSRTGEHSPDRADAFMLTFAVNVLRRDAQLDWRVNRNRHQAVVEYDEFSQ